MNEDIEYKDYSSKKGIVVDDDNINLNIAARFLEPYNLRADKSLDASGLLEKIMLGGSYDLIILDDMMPNMTGTEAMKKLKTDKNFKTPIVVLTGNDVEGAKDEYIKAGFDDYISKPINKKEYDRIIKKYLN